MQATCTSSSVLANLIDSSDGKFVSVDFVKKDGTIRNLNGRLGVTKYLKGGERTTDPNKFICIYDTVNKGYRSINRSSILKVKVAGIEAVKV